MSAVEEPTARIAHDFNNLLTVVKANALLLVGRAGDERSRAAAAEIVRAADAGADLTAELAEIARVRSAR